MAQKKTHFNHSKQQNPALQKAIQKKAEQKALQEALDAVKESDIYGFYSKYQAFMDWKDAPNFKVNPIITNKYHAESKMPDSPGEPFIIEISPVVSKIQGRSYQAILYHEFTHIYDDSTIHKTVMESGIPQTTTWYTEAHAIEIELLLLCGFESATDRRRIPVDTTIHYCGADISLMEFGNQKKNEYLNHLSTAKDKLKNGIRHEATTCYAEALKRLQYYWGFLRFLKLHCVVHADTIINLIKENTFEEELGICILEIGKVVLKKDVSTPDFARLKEYDNNMFRFWMLKNSISAKEDAR